MHHFVWARTVFALYMALSGRFLQGVCWFGNLSRKGFWINSVDV